MEYNNTLKITHDDCGSGLSRNMYKGHVDKAKGGRIGAGLEWVGQGASGGVKIE